LRLIRETAGYLAAVYHRDDGVPGASDWSDDTLTGAVVDRAEDSGRLRNGSIAPR
jgi:hypothetical protein